MNDKQSQQILNTTALKKLQKENNWRDNWLYTIDGNAEKLSSKLATLPRSGVVRVINCDADQGCESDWSIFRYPGFLTKEEIQIKEEREIALKAPTANQIIALEFFGVDTTAISRSDASEILDQKFSAPFNKAAYEAYRWKMRSRIYSRQEIFERWLTKYKWEEFFIRENVEPNTLTAISIELAQSDVSEDGILEFIKTNHPDILLAESTTKRKRSDATTNNQFTQAIQHRSISRQTYGDSQSQKSAQATPENNVNPLFLIAAIAIFILFILILL